MTKLPSVPITYTVPLKKSSNQMQIMDHLFIPNLR